MNTSGGSNPYVPPTSTDTRVGSLHVTAIVLAVLVSGALVGFGLATGTIFGPSNSRDVLMPDMIPILVTSFLLANLLCGLLLGAYLASTRASFSVHLAFVAAGYIVAIALATTAIACYTLCHAVIAERFRDQALQEVFLTLDCAVFCSCLLIALWRWMPKK